jgi:hypothetical protein
MLDNYTLSNGLEIHNVFIRESNPQYTRQVSKVYYHYNYGIIRIEYSNGRKVKLQLSN